MSVIAAFASFSSLAFLSRWAFVGNGVIAVTQLTARGGADDDADNQAGINRGDSAHTSISRPFPPFNVCNQAVRTYARTDHNQRPAVKRNIAATVDCLTDITTINHQVKRHAP